MINDNNNKQKQRTHTHKKKKRNKDDDTFCIQAIHHGRNDFQFVLNREIDEVGINQDMIRGSQLRVI